MISKFYPHEKRNIPILEKNDARISKEKIPNFHFKRFFLKIREK